MIVDINELTERDINQIEDIFFESSAVKKFETIKAKNDFKQKYLTYYLENDPKLFFAFREKEMILGYVCGCENTLADETFFKVHSYYKKFEDHCLKFPAHLHINIHVEARGKKIGEQLVHHFISHLSAKGVHIITSRDARNRSFYERLGFTNCYEKKDLLFMGKSI